MLVLVKETEKVRSLFFFFFFFLSISFHPYYSLLPIPIITDYYHYYPYTIHTLYTAFSHFPPSCETFFLPSFFYFYFFILFIF